MAKINKAVAQKEIIRIFRSDLAAYKNVMYLMPFQLCYFIRFIQLAFYEINTFSCIEEHIDPKQRLACSFDILKTTNLGVNFVSNDTNGYEHNVAEKSEHNFKFQTMFELNEPHRHKHMSNEARACQI